MVAKFILFIRKGCPFCTRAKAMLDKHGLSYHSYIMDDHKDLFNEYCKSSNRYPPRVTVPQIFLLRNGSIEDIRHIGGSDDLHEYLSRHPSI